METCLSRKKDLIVFVAGACFRYPTYNVIDIARGALGARAVPTVSTKIGEGLNLED